MPIFFHDGASSQNLRDMVEIRRKVEVETPFIVETLQTITGNPDFLGSASAMVHISCGTCTSIIAFDCIMHWCVHGTAYC